MKKIILLAAASSASLLLMGMSASSIEEPNQSEALASLRLANILADHRAGYIGSVVEDAVVAQNVGDPDRLRIMLDYIGLGKGGELSGDYATVANAFRSSISLLAATGREEDCIRALGLLLEYDNWLTVRSDSKSLDQPLQIDPLLFSDNEEYAEYKEKNNELVARRMISKEMAGSRKLYLEILPAILEKLDIPEPLASKIEQIPD